MTYPCGSSTLGDFYFGNVGDMEALTLPDSGMTAPVARAATLHTSASGGATVTRRPKPRRTYGFAHTGLTPDTADALLSYFIGARGSGPFVMIDPTFRNHLAEPTATMGAVRRANTLWQVESTAVPASFDSTVASPVRGSGVLRWLSPAAGDSLWEGDSGVVPIVPSFANAVPYVPDLDYCLSLWLKLDAVDSAPTPAILTLAAALRTGWTGTYGSPAALTITPDWQRFTVSILATDGIPQSGADFVLPVITTPGAASGDVLVAGAQIEIGRTMPLAWTTGIGCPRLVVPDALASASTVTWRRNSAISFAEV